MKGKITKTEKIEIIGFSLGIIGVLLFFLDVYIMWFACDAPFCKLFGPSEWLFNILEKVIYLSPFTLLLLIFNIIKKKKNVLLLRISLLLLNLYLIMHFTITWSTAAIH